jgi:glycosyltransferase involved in cell wall biosynthesis
MSGQIRVMHFCRHPSLGGTEKAVEIFCRHMDRARFIPMVATMPFVAPREELWKARLMARLGSERYSSKLEEWRSVNARLSNFEETCGAQNVLLAAEWEVLREKILHAKPNILHLHYGGDKNFALEDQSFLKEIPVVVATHVFAQADRSPGQKAVKKMFFVSDWLRRQAESWTGADPRASVLYNPIEKPASEENLRQALGIGPKVFVVGRIGRPASSIHHPLALAAYAKIEREGETIFLAVAPSRKLREQARELKLTTFREYPATADGVELSRFYNTIDVLAHSRLDGETFGMNLAEAMRHSKPVITHRHPQVNGHLEVVGEAGLVTGFEDIDDYAEKLKELRDNPAYREQLGQLCRERAHKLFDAGQLTRQLESAYKEAIALK